MSYQKSLETALYFSTWRAAPDGDGLFWLWEPKANKTRVVEVSTANGGTIDHWSVWDIGTEKPSPLAAFPGAKWRRVQPPSPPPPAWPPKNP